MGLQRSAVAVDRLAVRVAVAIRIAALGEWAVAGEASSAQSAVGEAAEAAVALAAAG